MGFRLISLKRTYFAFCSCCLNFEMLMYLSLVCCSISFLLLYDNNFSLNSEVWGERNFANAFSAKPKKKKNLGDFCRFGLPQIVLCIPRWNYCKAHVPCKQVKDKGRNYCAYEKIRAGLWLQFKRRDCSEWEGERWTIDFVWMRLAPMMGAGSYIMLSVERSSCFRVIFFFSP